MTPLVQRQFVVYHFRRSETVLVTAACHLWCPPVRLNAVDVSIYGMSMGDVGFMSC